MKKKLLVIMLALCLVFSAFAGCTPVETENPDETPSGTPSGTTPTTPTTPTATPPADVTGLAVDALGNITWTEGTDAVAWSVQYKLGNGDYVQYAVVDEASASVTEILKTIEVATLKSANAKNMNVQVAAIDSDEEIGNYVELANVLGTYGNNTPKKLRTVTTLAELKDVGDSGDYVVIANDITVDATSAYAAIETATKNVDGASADEDTYFIGTRLFSGTLNGLGHTLSYTLVDDQQRSKEFGGIWSSVKFATIMNFNVQADITKDFDKTQVNMDRWTCPVSWTWRRSSVYNCNIQAIYRMPNQTADKSRFGLGMYVCDDTLFDGCTFAFAAFKVENTTDEPRNFLLISNETGHSTGVLTWSGGESKTTFKNCTYVMPTTTAPAETYNPFVGNQGICGTGNKLLVGTTEIEKVVPVA